MANLPRIPTSRQPILAQPTDQLRGRPSPSSPLESISSAIDSPLGQLGIGGLGAFLTNRQQQGNIAQQQALQQQQMAQQQAVAMSNLLGDHTLDDRQRATSAARPLGESTDYATKRAILAALLPQLSGHTYAPGDASVRGAMGPQQTPLNMATLLSNPQVRAALSPDATGAAIGQRDRDVLNINPRAAATNTGALGLPSDPGVSQWGTDAQGRLDEQRAMQRQALMQAIDKGAQAQQNGPPPDGYEYDKKTGQLKKKGSGLLGTLAKVGGIAGAGLATALTAGGASPLLAGAIGIGSGALSGAAGGGGVKGALLGGSLGAIPGIAGSVAKPAAAAGGLTQTLRDPRFWLSQAPQMIGRR